MSFARQLPLACLLVFLPLRGSRAADFGPLFADFPLTLADGHRTEAVGPFFYDDLQGYQHMWAVPPLFSTTHDPDLDYRESSFLYPLLTLDRFGEQSRYQFMQIFSVASTPLGDEPVRKRFTVFPIFFRQVSSVSDENYTAVVPFYGRLTHRLMRDEIEFAMFPLWSRTVKRSVVTQNYLYPFFHWREGPGLSGWQFWPLLGKERKEVTYTTNGFGDVLTVGGHDRQFALWPFYYNSHVGLGTTNVERHQGVLPLYSVSRAPLRDSTTVLWPFFSKIEDREKKYTEWQTPWPLFGYAKGEGKSMIRVLPLYRRTQTPTHESVNYLWPVYRYRRAHVAPLDRERAQILFFFSSNLRERNTETGAAKRRVDLLPLFTWRKELNGNVRLQVFAPLEPVLPANKTIERHYSPIWSLWRSEANPRTGASSQSLLWNLYRRDASPTAHKTSFLFGMFQHEKTEDAKRLRLLYIPLTKSITAPEDRPGPETPDGR